MHWCPGGPRWFSNVVLIGSLSLTSLGSASATPKPPSLTGRWRAWFRLDTASRLVRRPSPRGDRSTVLPPGATGEFTARRAYLAPRAPGHRGRRVQAIRKQILLEDPSGNPI